MTAVVKRWEGGGRAGYNFRCPGCREVHSLPTEGDGVRWSFTGDAARPVFTPSVLVTWSEPSDVEEHFDDPAHDIKRVCHSFIGCNGAQPGQIVFLGDCTHALAGKVVDLPAWAPAPDFAP